MLETNCIEKFHYTRLIYSALCFYLCVCMYVYTPPTPTPVSGKKEKKEAKEAVQMAWGFFPTPCCAE